MKHSRSQAKKKNLIEILSQIADAKQVDINDLLEWYEDDEDYLRDIINYEDYLRDIMAEEERFFEDDLFEDDDYMPFFDDLDDCQEWA